MALKVVGLRGEACGVLSRTPRLPSSPSYFSIHFDASQNGFESRPASSPAYPRIGFGRLQTGQVLVPVSVVDG